MTFSTFMSPYCLIENHTKDLCHRSDNPPETEQVNDTRLVTQITYAVLYKHSSHSLHFCITPPNVWKCYKDYFPSTPIYSYPSTFPSTGIWSPRAVLCKVIMTLGYALGHTDIQADNKNKITQY